MENMTGIERQTSSPVQTIIETVKKVILTPTEFYRGMPKIGGFVDPLIFAVVLGFVTGIIHAILGLVHIGPVMSVKMALVAVIMMPVWVLIGGFIGAAIIFVIWKLMGSNESYETAYRCGAYASAVSPITALAGAIPVVGPLVGLVWMLFLIVTASVEVHKIPAKKAWLVFGIIAAVFALLGVGAKAGASKAQQRMTDLQKEMGITPDKDMTPEDAGKAAAAFVKTMQEQAMKQAEEQAKKAKEGNE
ncbi:MAG: Yip1 family protein [bacterium]